MKKTNYHPFTGRLALKTRVRLFFLIQNTEKNGALRCSHQKVSESEDSDCLD